MGGYGGMAWFFLLLSLIELSPMVSSSHFRGGIIMARPNPGGTQYQMEISYHVSWRRTSGGHYCDSGTIARHNINTEGNLQCQYGCSGTISPMSYMCTSFSAQENWSFGGFQLVHDFSLAAAGRTITIGFTGNAWIAPISSNWNISTTFSLTVRNDTGRINSTPRAITAPVIRLQAGCNHTIALAVSDPDDDIVRCRWAVGRECGSICYLQGAFPGAMLYNDTCIIYYEATRGARYWGVAVMIEDFTPGSTEPLSSVALQFLVLVDQSMTQSCSQKPTFIHPTLPHGSCVAIPPGTTFRTQLIADSGSSDTSIVEIQTLPPLGTIVGQLTRISNSNNYYVRNITWTPSINQQNQTHLFCFTAVKSDRLSSDQTCINLLPGYFPPAPIPSTAMPNHQLVHPSNTTWHIRFDNDIERPSLMAYITFHEYNSEEEVHRIDASRSPEVTYIHPDVLSITPNFIFFEKMHFYITFERGVIQGLERCGPENEPVVDKNFWTFETMDITPPTIIFLLNTAVTNTNVSFSWESNENVTWECFLQHSMVVSSVNCSEAHWSGYGLNEGLYRLEIRATDDAGNIATVTHVFRVDLTPPIVTISRAPSPVSNELTPVLTFFCNEPPCSFECLLRPNVVQLSPSSCNEGQFITPPPLRGHSNYTFLVKATDQIGNSGDTVSYSWQTDFESPRIFGIQNTSTTCNNITPETTGQAMAVDNRPENVSVTYSDTHLGCSIGRTWTATDIAGNTGQVVQNIDLEFSPVVTLLPQVSLPCDSAASSLNNATAYVPNPCGLPLQLSYQDSAFICPGNFVRNWTASACGNSANASQTVRSYYLCPPNACGRNESIPRGICFLGECQCNPPWYGDNCSTVIYTPIAELINDSILLEAQEYRTTVRVSQGSPQLSWSLISGPENLLVDQYTGQVMWNRAQAGHHMVVIQIENQVGSIQVEWTLEVIPGYNASLLHLSPRIFPYAQPIVLTGYVEYATNSVVEGALTGIVPVCIDVTCDGVTRIIKTFTSSNGLFSFTFSPPSTEYGMYTVGARHPSLTQSNSLMEFRILGMKSIPRTITLNGEARQGFEMTFYNATIIHNDGPGTLTGLSATAVLPNTTDLSVEIFLGATSNRTLEPGEQLVMDIRVISSRPLNGLFLISVEAIEGTTLRLISNLQIEPVLPSLLIDPPSLNTRIVQGRSRIFQFNVTNVGRATANNVRSIIPHNNIISFISLGNVDESMGGLRLRNGESALFSILVQIPASYRLGRIDATLVITSNEVHTQLPVSLIVSSDSLMNLTVVVEDEYTYFASGRPLVSNAEVTFINRERNIRLTQSTELGNGTVTFDNIYEDRYEMIVEAPSHRTYRQIIITSVNSPTMTVFIRRQTVTYTWSVTPISIRDTYSISIEADFETEVPIPVVTVTPNEINLDQLESGLINFIQLNITNHGLIRADNVGIQLPSHPFLQFSTPIEELGYLEPLSSIIVLVNTSRRSVQKRSIVSVATWAIYIIDIVHSYVCNEPQFRRTPVVLKKRTIRTIQLSQPFSGTLVDSTSRPTSGGSGSGSGSFSFRGYSHTTMVFCNPCVSGILKCLPRPSLSGNIVNAVLRRIPYVRRSKHATCLPDIVSNRNDIVALAFTIARCAINSTIFNVLSCAYENDLYNACLTSKTRSKRNVGRSLNRLVEAMYPIQQSIVLGTELLGDAVWISTGDSQWVSSVLQPAMDDQSEAGTLISATEFSTILAAPPPNGTTVEMVGRMIHRLNNTLFGWNNGRLEPMDGSNMASFSTIQEFARNIETYNDIAVRNGFSSYIDAYNFASGELNMIRNIEDEVGVCAVVRIRIEQELAITREAFLARLQIENQEDLSLEQISVEIIITDIITGELSTNRFSIGNATLSGSLTANTNGVWSLSSEGTGAVEWLIIPYSEAAPDSDHIYNVGGSLNYFLGNENITVPLSPAPITVRPDPSLLVHYFFERYVVADDPFTETIEPSVPFTLGVVVKNAGYGTAYNLQILSSQPEIIDNERGLLISFMIIGANIGGERASPSLTTNFGDLAPNTTTVARWYMISNLCGEFMSYSATFENRNPLGDPKLSLLDDLQIHELIRDVVIYTSNEDDGIPDFLVNDQDDYQAYPDALYSSRSLQSYNVSVGIIHSVTTNSASSLLVRTSTNITGWVYYRYEDTKGILNNTASSLNATKYEGNQTIVLPSENLWITRNRNARNGTETFYLHILDYVLISDEVIFTLVLCTVNCSTLELPFSQPTAKLPTPSVSITAPMDILYAGTTTPLTLTCSVNIDPSLTSDVNVSLSWLRGASQLFNGTSRALISPLSESQSVFTSTLTVYPLSTVDSTNFTCRAGIIPQSDRFNSTAASDLGEETVLIIVQSLPPYPPTISVILRYPYFDNNCGEARIFNCTASTVENIFSHSNITWIDPDGQEVPAGGSNNPVVNPRTKQLIFNDITSRNSGAYVCRAVLNIPEAGIFDHFDDATILINTNTPGPVNNLICNESSSSSELSFSWESPTELREEVISYQVEVKELQQRDGTKDVVFVDITDFNTKMREISLREGLTGMVPYEIRVKATNLAGCGEQQYLYCFTEEGKPPSPRNVVVFKINSTALNVTWDKQTLVELKGLADYIVEYSPAISERRQMVTVPWTESHVIITNLTLGAQYDITVSVITSVGMSDSVQGVIRDVMTTPPSVADVNTVAAIFGSTLALVILIAIVVAIPVIAVTVRRDKSKQESTSSVPPGASYDNAAYENEHFDDGMPEQQQSSL